jgi:hypothetical protein
MGHPATAKKKKLARTHATLSSSKLKSETAKTPRKKKPTAKAKKAQRSP